MRYSIFLVSTFMLASSAMAKSPKGDGLTNQEIIETVQKYNDDARNCYLAQLEKDKTAEGKVKIRMLIDLKGKVSASRLEQNTFKDKSLGQCLMDKMKAWQFPKPRGGEIVSAAYPFEFKTAPAPTPSPSPAQEQAPAATPSAPAPAQEPTPAAAPQP